MLQKFRHVFRYKNISNLSRAYRKYFYETLVEIYLYYSSPWPFHYVIKRKWPWPIEK